MERTYDARRAMLLLVAQPGATRAQAAAELAGRAAPIRQRALDAGVRLRLGTEIADDPLIAVATQLGRDVTAVAVTVEITGPRETPEETFLRVLDGFGNWFGGVFDKARSAAALGSVLKITGGPPGPVMLVLATRRRDGMSLEEFHRYWADVHAPLALPLWPEGAVERVGYQQFHLDEAASARAAEAAGVGTAHHSGVLQVLCRTPDDFLAINTDPAYAATIYEDELKFTKQGAMLGAFLELTD